jgi:hypothetical protein
MSDMHSVLNNYEANVLPSQRTKDVHKIAADITNHLIQNQGTMAGDVYQATRSRLGRLANSTNDSELKVALAGAPGAGGGLKGALDAAMQRGLTPADAQAWQLNNQRYAIMKTLEPTLAQNPGNMSPLGVARALSSDNPARYAAEAGAADALARAGKKILAPLPQSGTGPRVAAQTFFNIPAMIASAKAAGAGGLTGFGVAGFPGAIAGAVAPFVASRLALTSGGQRYLGNQLLPQNPRDILAQALVQQAASQPSGVEQNQAAQAAYQQKRLEDLRKAGLQ